ncbi:MAG: thiamine phosphate synthase [Candidatus Krumholzibacteriales bacterium]
MDITFLTTAAGGAGAVPRSGTVAVIDVLRATSCMVRAIENGASRVIPAAGPGQAGELAEAFPPGKAVLAGEADGKPLEGFDLFNSPGEFTPEAVEGKTVIMSTSNGTGAVRAAAAAEKVYICSLTNVDSVARECGSADSLVILCSGNQGRVCSEDILCGGILLQVLESRRQESRLDDAARISLLLAEEFGEDPYRMLKDCDRGTALEEAGYGQDVVDCSARGSSLAVPILRSGEIVNSERPLFSIPEKPFLYAILDRSVIPGSETAAAARSLAEGGVDLVQYRAKGLPEKEKIEDIRAAMEQLSKNRIPLIINDDPLLAQKSGAAGVHLGREDPCPAKAREILGRDAIIGVTVHSAGELEEAPLEVLDYISAGAVFSSPTKPGIEVAGTSFISRIRERTSLPLVAIGGITPDNAPEVLKAGADGMAVISSIFSGDIKKNCFTFRRIIDKNIR